MAASPDDLFMEVGDPGTATTLSAPGYTSGGTTINVGSTSNWPTATGIIFAIDEAEVVDGEEVRIDGTYNEFEGTVATGTSITGVDWVKGVGDRNYAAGALTRVYIPVSAERENRIAQGILVHADQDGTLKAGAVDVAGVLASNVVTTAKILDSNVTTAKLATDSVTLSKIATSELTPHYKEVTSAITSGGAGVFSTSGISVLAGDVVIAKTGTYEVSVYLPSVYAESTTTQWNLRVKSGSTTFFDTTTGTAVAPVAFASAPLPFLWRRRMSLTAGTYTTTFEWYGVTAGAGNEIFVGAGTDQPATFIVKAV